VRLHAQPFSGVIKNVPIADLTAQGWSQCFRDNYVESNHSISALLGACNQNYLLLACRPVGSSTLTMAAAAPRSDVTFDTGSGQ
jgi:hypothetical protein